MKDNVRIVLASSSPRRKLLLTSLLANFGLKFEVIPANINEELPQKYDRPGRLAVKLARIKAEKVAENQRGIILGADTIVVLKGRILGKPGSKSEAKKMLLQLSNNFHFVYTGLYFINTSGMGDYAAYEKTKVRFRRLSGREIEFYVESGSPYDKAGGYGIQDDFGSTFVSGINGDFFNVVGLPIYKTYVGLKRITDLEI